MTVLGPELKAGDKAPDFQAVDDWLKPVDSGGHRQRRPHFQRRSVARHAGVRRADQALQRRSRQAARTSASTPSAWICRSRRSAGAARSAWIT